MSSTVEPPVYQRASLALKVDLVYIAMIKYSNRTYTQGQKYSNETVSCIVGICLL